jgi:predicted patatin/cPLA2 family phospholipase
MRWETRCCWTRATAILTLALMLGCSGCAASVARRPVPNALADVACVRGMPPGVRAWGDQFSPDFQRSVIDSIAQVTAAYGEHPPTDVLAISGGGANGAFAAGLLRGWSEAGNRPTFRLVTGVSVGAIIAPFAFLGPEYDEKLRELATTVSDEKVYRRKELLGSLRSDSVTDTAPLARLLRRYYNRDVMRAVAAEHAKGRRLYIGTTNLDSGRPVIWDLGAIAASGSPDALKLFQQVILASAAIPVLFRPTYINVEADGQRYDEMHVDGGVTAQAILYGNAISIADMKRHIPGVDDPGAPTPTVYIIRNAKFDPDHHTVKPKVIPIAARAVMTLVKAQGLGDVYRLHAVCRRDELEFRLASIPSDLTLPRATKIFDSGQIETLYRCGYELGRSGYPWTNEPPGLSPAHHYQVEATHPRGD